MTAPNQRERILPRLIEDEMRESFIDYSMSVIVQRALPDVRDGLKPVPIDRFMAFECGVLNAHHQRDQESATRAILKHRLTARVMATSCGHLRDRSTRKRWSRSTTDHTTFTE